MKNWEIQIGEAIELVDFKKGPHITVQITDEQFEIVQMFASTRKDANMNTIYTLNKVDFLVVPLFKSALDIPIFDADLNYSSGAVVLFEGKKYELQFWPNGDPIFHIAGSGLPCNIQLHWCLV